jgi:hypothetical protein
MSWCNYSVLSIDRLVSAFKSVTDIRLDALFFNNPTHLLSVVARFPALQRLSVNNLAFFSDFSHPGLDIADIIIPPKVHDLELNETFRRHTRILEWFSSRRRLVNSLSIDLETIVSPRVNQYLRVLGPSLLFLQMEVRFCTAGACSFLFSTNQACLTRLPNAEIYLSGLNLSFSTHLQKLRFCDFGFVSRHGLSSIIPSMLATTTSSYINEIEFAYVMLEERHLKLENDVKSGPSMWRALDHVLSSFSSLRTVRFRFSPGQSDPLSFVGYVKRGLSSCNARGLLSFVHGLDGMSESGPELGTCHSPMFCAERDIWLPSLHSASQNGVVSGPLRIAQLQEPTA